ncbi:MAG: helix-turn-helix domain-containing protein [Eubacteriales bacterium]
MRPQSHEEHIRHTFDSFCKKILKYKARDYYHKVKRADTLLKHNEAYRLVFREYPDVVSVEQMCEMLGGISAKTGYRLLRQNQIKHFKIGRTYKIPKLHIFEYLAVVQEESDA